MASHSFFPITYFDSDVGVLFQLKVIKYNDELESGKRSRKSELSISQQVENYRRKLLQKEEEKAREKEKSRDKGRERVCRAITLLASCALICIATLHRIATLASRTL